MNDRSLEIDVTLKVPFHDVDSMNVVWHGNYPKYFAVARCALLDRLDYNYQQMKNSGYAWPVIDMRIKYVKPALFNQEITVQAKLVEWEHRLKFNYLIKDRVTGEKLTKGYTVQVAVDLSSNEMKLYSPGILMEKIGLKV